MELMGKQIKMGIKEMTLLLLMAIFICSSSSAASTTHLANNPSLDSYKGGRGIANQTKFGHGGGGGGGRGGGEHGTNGGEANGDRSHNPTGGASVIPLYAAGANNHHNNHHGGGDCRHGSINSAALTAAVLESLLLYIYKDF